MKKILPFFSYLFHPIFIPDFAALYYFFLYDSNFSNREKYFAIFQIDIITVIIPVLVFLLLRSAGKVDSIMISKISQRKIPLIVQCFLMILLAIRIIPLKQYPELHYFFLGGLLSTLLALSLLFLKTKGSLHTMTISGLTLFVIGLSIHNETQNLNAIAFLLLMNGFVASSRLKMKAHSKKELVIGFLLGIIPQLIFMRFWL